MSRPMKLSVNKEEKGYGLELDGNRLHHVIEYKIESQQKGYAELSIRMVVQYPVIPGNTL